MSNPIRKLNRQNLSRDKKPVASRRKGIADRRILSEEFYENGSRYYRVTYHATKGRRTKRVSREVYLLETQANV